MEVLGARGHGDGHDVVRSGDHEDHILGAARGRRSQRARPPTDDRRTVVELTLESSTRGDWTVLDVGGEVDLSSAPALRAALETAIALPTRGVVVDLSDVGFMDSSGLSVLVAGLKVARESGGDLAVVCRNESIVKVFTVTGLDRLFAVHGDVDEATAT